MNFSVKQINFYLTTITLLSYWLAFVPTESHVLKVVLNSTDTNDEAVLHFKKLAKTHNLHNPCFSGRHPSEDGKEHLTFEDEISNSEPTGLVGSHGNKLGLALLRELITKSTFLQGLATNVIRMVSHSYLCCRMLS